MALISAFAPADLAVTVGSQRSMVARCGLPTVLILVDEPAEAVVSFDLVDLGYCVTGEWSCGSGLPTVRCGR
jgi:hypothetical protein